MAFSSTLEMAGSVAKITLTGELDASVAQEFRDKVELAASKSARRLALIMTKLDYMSSAGLRVLVFAKQKMGAGVDIYVVGANETVAEPITMTGLHHSVTMVDEYDASVIENV